MVAKWNWVWSVGCASQFKIQIHGFLLANIQTLLKDVRCYGAYLEVDMVKAYMMVLEQ
jgi:hypothetical protein